MKGKNSVFGPVADSWFQFEEQGRGSLHLHLLLWLERPDNQASQSGGSQDTSATEDDAFPKAFALARAPRGSHPFVQRLRQAVISRNTHARCDPNACGKRCSKEDHLPPHHPEMRCAKGYPFPQKTTRDSTHECDKWCPKKTAGLRCRLADRQEYTRLRREDDRVSPYHPFTFAAYPSHENVQEVTKESFAAYLVKYAAKVEPTGKVSNPLDSVKESQLPRDGPRQGGLQSVHHRQLPYILGRKIAMSEAALILSGQPLCLKSRVYMFLDTRLPHLRRVILSREGAAGNGQSGVVDGMIEKYCKRPSGVRPAENMPNSLHAIIDFDSLKYDDFWLEWEVLPADGSRSPPRTLPYYLNQEGTTYWRKTGGERILGYSSYRPDRQPTEQFYYHLLILSRPFRRLKEFVTESNEEGTYERQCQLEEVFGDEDRTTQGILAALENDLLKRKVSFYCKCSSASVIERGL